MELLNIELFKYIVTYLIDIFLNIKVLVIFFLFGILSTILFGFFQLKNFSRVFKLSMESTSSSEGVSSFQSLMLSISGRVGTGNIVGVSTCILAGGPGAIFWMWLSAFFGCATALVETTLAQLYKISYKGQYRASQSLYIKDLIIHYFGDKYLSIGIAIGCITALISAIVFMILLMGTQINAITRLTGGSEPGQIPYIYISLTITVVYLYAITGGIHRIAKLSEFLVIIMGVLYTLIGVITLLYYFNEIPSALYLIVSSAFSPNALLGGMLGVAFQKGISRGILSNEAGMGCSGTHIGGISDVDHPAQAGFVQAFSIYIDTFLFCSITALVVILTDSYNVISPDGSIIYSGSSLQSGIDGAKFIPIAVSKVFGEYIAYYIVPIIVSLFAFSTMIALYYIGETNVNILDVYIGARTYIFGLSLSKLIVYPTSIVCIILLGVLEESFIWDIGTLGIGILVCINLIAMIAGLPLVYTLFKDYLKQYKNKTVKFDTSILNLKKDNFWHSRMKH